MHMESLNSQRQSQNGVRGIALTGRRTTHSFSRVLPIVGSRDVLAFIVGPAVLMTVVDIETSETSLQVWSCFLFWLLVSGFYVLLFFSWMVFIGGFLGRFGLRNVHFILCSACCVAITYTLGVSLLALVEQGQLSLTGFTFSRLLAYLLAEQVFVTAYTHWCGRPSGREAHERENQDNMMETSHTETAGAFPDNLCPEVRRFVFSTATWYIVSEEHYLRVVGSDGTQLIRGRISDVQKCSHEVGGIMLHRSSWLSPTGFEEVHSANRNLFVTAKDKAVLKVANSRRKAVIDWANNLLQLRDAELAKSDRVHSRGTQWSTPMAQPCSIDKEKTATRNPRREKTNP